MLLPHSPQNLYIDVLINFLLKLIPFKSDFSNSWNNSQTILEAAFPSTALPAPVVSNSLVSKISYSNSDNAFDIFGHILLVNINSQDF